MTLLIPSQPPPIDHSKSGLLQISPLMVGYLLRLPAHQQVVGAAMLPSGNLSLIVCGQGMLRIDHKGNPRPVSLTLEDVRRPSAIRPDSFERRTMASWNHDPGFKWVIFDWRPESPPPAPVAANGGKPP